MQQFIQYRDVWKYLLGVGKRHGTDIAYVKLHLLLNVCSFDTLGIWITRDTWSDL